MRNKIILTIIFITSILSIIIKDLNFILGGVSLSTLIALITE